MIKIGICDDELGICSYLEEAVETYFNNNVIQVEISTYTRAEDLLYDIDQNKSFDLIFLDIEMGKLSGIGLAKSIRNKFNNEDIKIVFISWKKNYALDLFNIGTFDFLIKPINEEKIDKLLKRFKDLFSSENQKFMYRVNGVSKFKELKEISYFTCRGRKVLMYDQVNSYEFIDKLDQVEERVHTTFWRIHKSILINVNQVEKFSYTHVTMTCGVELSISQPYRVAVRKKQMQLLKGDNV